MEKPDFQGVKGFLGYKNKACLSYGYNKQKITLRHSCDMEIGEGWQIGKPREVCEARKVVGPHSLGVGSRGGPLPNPQEYFVTISSLCDACLEHSRTQHVF